MSAGTPAPSRLLVQVGWLLLYWLLGVLSMAVVAVAIRWLLPR